MYYQGRWMQEAGDIKGAASTAIGVGATATPPSVILSFGLHSCYPAAVRSQVFPRSKRTGAVGKRSPHFDQQSH